MILIADSCSTKTDWRLVEHGEITNQIKSNGINPFYQSEYEIASELKSILPYTDESLKNIYFYGAGCTPEKIEPLKKIFNKIFTDVAVDVNSDLLAAARALCLNKKGIACILGTGANTCLYNGNEIVNNIPTLGYMLGDEGSGAVLGKKTIVAYLREYMPKKLLDSFSEQYKTNKQQVLDNVYKKPFPNRYLASFTKFLSQNINHEFVQQLLYEHFDEFFNRTIFHYDNYLEYEVNFVGSIAFYFSDAIRNVAENRRIKIGRILETPINGLVEYHKVN